MLIIPVAIKSILCFTPSSETLRPRNYMPNCTPIFLFCSIIKTQLPSTSLKRELQFLLVLEMGIFHTLTLNFKDWRFGVIVTRHFRSKSDQLNGSVYCKPIDRSDCMFLSCHVRISKWIHTLWFEPRCS